MDVGKNLIIGTGFLAATAGAGSFFLDFSTQNEKTEKTVKENISTTGTNSPIITETNGDVILNFSKDDK